MTEFAAKFDWVPVMTRGDRRPYCFGRKRTRLGSDCPGPAVYRWMFLPLGTPPVCLVGSTEDLYRRVAEYISHSGIHHQNVRGEFENHLSSGGSVNLEMLLFEPFCLNGAEFSHRRLVDPFIREGLEKICCAVLQNQGFRLLNSTMEKRYVRKLISMQKKSPEGFAQILNMLKAKSNTLTKQDK